MKSRSAVKLVPALFGLLALTVYILACTSFSPDDTKVLYPAFDAPSGALGMALYDRESHRSEMLFLPVTREGVTNRPALCFVRGQWLADGHNLVLAWSSNEGPDENTLSLALMPWGARQTALKLFRLPDIKEAGALLQFPLCLAGERLLFLRDNTLVRLDLKTGTLVTHELAKEEQGLTLLPAPDGHQVFYAGKNNVFGRLEPETFRCTPLMNITNDFIDGSFIAYDAKGTTLAGVVSSGGSNQVVVLREGKTIFSRPLGAGLEEATFGNGLFSRQGDRIWASYQKPLSTNTVAYGLVDIPLSDAPIREITLIPSAPKDKDSMAAFFQFGMSHDGKTAAVASTYLAAGDSPLRPEDCALFLVDLKDPKHKVTKVPLTMPGGR